MSDSHDDLVLRIVVVVTLGIVLGLAVIGLTVVAVATDRDLTRPEFLTFGGVVLLAGLGGVSWWGLHRHRRWRVALERNGSHPEAPPAPRPRSDQIPILGNVEDPDDE